MSNIAKHKSTINLDGRAERLAALLVMFRNKQDQVSTDFLNSLGTLSMQELNVLNVIGDNQPCIMSQIAKLAVLSMSSITLIVDKLVKRKLVKRVRSEEDRRVIHVVLTKEGLQIHAVQVAHLHNVVRRMLGVLSAQEQEQFVGMLHKMIVSWD